MLHPSTKRLIDKLDEMTRKQRVGWEESDNGSIKHDTEGYRVTLTAAPHSLLLTDTLGREIETCTPEDFAGETDASGRPYTEFVEEMYREAHRHARGAEKAISALLSSLDEADADSEAKAEIAEPLNQPESFEHPEDAGDESRPLEDHELPEPEYEGQADMQAAIAAMADQMNAVPPEATHIAEDSELDAAPEPEPEPVVEPPAMPVFTEAPAEQPAPAPEPALEPAPEPVAEVAAEPYAPFAGSEETARNYAAAAEFETPAAPDPEPTAEEPFGGENDVWESIRNAGGEAEAPAAQPEAPEQEPAAAAQGRGPVFGSALYSNGLNDLSRYRTPEAEAEPDTPSEPEPEQAPEPPAEPAMEEVPEPAPELAPEPAPEQPAPRSFSLSGITSGFGLGSTHAAHRGQPETPATPAEPAEHRLIDGTLDLPDELPGDAPAPGQEWRMEQDEEFGFTDSDLMPGVPAEPLPAETETVPTEAQAPEAPAEKPETEAEMDNGHPARPTRRFNPWN